MGYGSVGDGNGICDSIFSEQPENLLSDESDHGSSVLSASYLFMMDSGVQERDVTLYNQESMGFGYISGEEYLIYGTDSTKLTFARPEVNENIQIADYERAV